MVWPALAYAGWVASRDGAAALRAAAGRSALVAGVGMFAAYALVLAALQRAPAAAVSAVRESSIVVAPLLAAALAWRAGPTARSRAGRGGGGGRGGAGGAGMIRAVSKQVSIARLRELGITPNRDLGQNFLIDDNVLRHDRPAAAAASRRRGARGGAGPGRADALAGRAHAAGACDRDRPPAAAGAGDDAGRAWTTCGCGSPTRMRVDLALARARRPARWSPTCPTAWRRR